MRSDSWAGGVFKIIVSNPPILMVGEIAGRGVVSVVSMVVVALGGKRKVVGGRDLMGWLAAAADGVTMFGVLMLLL